MTGIRLDGGGGEVNRAGTGPALRGCDGSGPRAVHSRPVASVLLLLGVLYFVAHFVALAYPAIRLPDVLFLMGLGILLGPVLGFVQPGDFGQVGRVLTTIALAVMLFESGTTLDLGAVVKTSRSTLILTFGSAALTLVLTALFARWVALKDAPWTSCFLAGSIICGTSSAVVIPLVKALGMRPGTGIPLILESALTDVICIVLAVGLIEASTSGEVGAAALFGHSLASLAVAGIIGHLGGVAWLFLWESVRRLPAALFTTLAFAFILYGITELLGFSGAITSLAFGFSIANSGRLYLGRLFKRKAFPGIQGEERNFFGEVVFLLKTFFFLYLGISMDFARWNLPMMGLLAGLVLLIYAGRALLCRFAFSTADTTRSEAALVSIMAPKGLAAAVLSSLPVEAGVPHADRIQMGVFALILVSITMTSLMVMVHRLPPFTLVPRILLASFPEATPAPAEGAPPPAEAPAPPPAAPPPSPPESPAPG